MSKLVWDVGGERYYETGTQKGVLYPQDENGTFVGGVAWSGLTGVTETPSGADANALYADDIKYLNLRAAETLGGTITAYRAPAEFEECDGTKSIAGIKFGQQSRKAFGFSFRSIIGNDTKSNDYAYKLHLIYNATASPADRGYSSVNESPEAIEFSWEFDTTAIDTHISDLKACSLITLDTSDYADENGKKFIAAVEDALYGTETTEPYLPMPWEVVQMAVKAGVTGASIDVIDTEYQTKTSITA